MLANLKNIPIKRLKLIFLGLFLPLFIFVILVIFVLKYFSYLFFPNTSQGIGYIEVENSNKKIEIEGDIENITSPKEKIIPQKEILDVKSSQTNTANWWEYPKNIKTTTRDGNDLLVLVNKKYKLPSNYSPSDLIIVSKSGIRVKGSLSVRKELINHLKNLNTKAKEENIDLSIISAYRLYSTQVNTYNYWVKYNKGCVSCADKISARPGHSQHQLGTAVDFSSKEIGDRLGSEFNNTKASKWLESNAYKYGFVISYPKGYEKITGYSYESWHYRYIGVENALKWKNSGMILEEWLRSKN